LPKANCAAHSSGGNTEASRSAIYRDRLALAWKLAFAIALAVPLLAPAREIVVGVPYVRSCEHIYIENCNIRDLSVTANCMVAHPDKPTPSGMNT
jgi:hypothetical protein